MTASPLWLAYEPNDVRPGWGALVLILVLALITYLLWRSMNTQLGRIQMPPRQRPPRGSDGAPNSAPDAADNGDDGQPPSTAPD